MQIDLSKPLSAAKFGELVGVTRQAVGQMRREGVLSPGGTAGEWLQEYTSHIREMAAGRADTPGAQLSRERILAAEADRREELAAMAAIKRRLQEGELTLVDNMTAMLSASFFALKTHVWNWQGTLPPKLYGLEMTQIAVVLERECREVLEHMAANYDKPTLKLIEWFKKNAPASTWKAGGPLQMKGDS